MTIKAIVFIKLQVNAMTKVIEKLKTIPQIKKLMSLTGAYDAIAEIETDTSDELYVIFSEKIDLIEGIIDTNTHIVMKEWNK